MRFKVGTTRAEGKIDQDESTGEGERGTKIKKRVSFLPLQKDEIKIVEDDDEDDV